MAHRECAARLKAGTLVRYRDGGDTGLAVVQSVRCEARPSRVARPDWGLVELATGADHKVLPTSAITHILEPVGE